MSLALRAFETLSSLSHSATPLFCGHTPWGLVAFLCLLFFLGGIFVGAGIALLCTSYACRRVLWLAVQGTSWATGQRARLLPLKIGRGCVNTAVDE